MFGRKTCLNGGKHKFEPRYDKKFPDWMGRVKTLDLKGDVSLMQESNYVCDVCQWCGKVVKREDDHD